MLVLTWPALLIRHSPCPLLLSRLSPLQVIKRTGVQMQQRAVPQVSVDSWQQKVERLEPQVESILWEEREEKALRKAEMEVQKVGGWKARLPAWRKDSCCPAAPGKLRCPGIGSKPLALRSLCQQAGIHAMW
jgi:hypothetical protein